MISTFAIHLYSNVLGLGGLGMLNSGNFTHGAKTLLGLNSGDMQYLHTFSEFSTGNNIHRRKVDRLHLSSIIKMQVSPIILQ